MPRKPLLWVVAVVTAIGLAASWLGTRFGINGRLVMLSWMLICLAVVSGYIAVKRSKLRTQLSELAAHERETLRQLHSDLQLTDKARSSGRVSADMATWIGLAWINLPVIPWLIAPLALRQHLTEPEPAGLTEGLLLLAGFVCAWLWWSVNVTLWRRWASSCGIDAADVQRQGENASILWPKGHFLERTELGHILERIRRRTDAI